MIEMSEIEKPYKAIDLAALLLKHDIYVKIHLPRPPEIDLEKVKTAVKNMSPEERALAFENARTMATHAQTVVEVIEEYM